MTPAFCWLFFYNYRSVQIYVERQLWLNNFAPTTFSNPYFHSTRAIALAVEKIISSRLGAWQNI